MIQLGRIARTVARVSRTRYPAFIAGLPLAPHEIPVFTFHDVEHDELARDLEFLRCNRYRTLTLEEYVRARAGKVHTGRSVLLTFDDARKSFWTTALPLLQEFSAHAVLFAPSLWMDAPRRASDDLFMSWEQVRACAQSGHVDVQSHAHRHALVFINEQLVAFAEPGALARFDIYDWPMRSSKGGGGKDGAAQEAFGRPPLGTPVYRAAPLLSASRRWVENEDLARACRGYVELRGGAAFFQQQDAWPRLRRFHDQRAARLRGRFLAENDFRKLVDSEFERSRAAFETHLGYAPTSIAYPWMLGSEFSLQLARRYGMQAAFGVALDYRAERRGARLPVPVHGRLKCDWLRFLPGTHRSSVLAAMRRKLAGFASVQHLAH